MAKQKLEFYSSGRGYWSGLGDLPSGTEFTAVIISEKGQAFVRCLARSHSGNRIICESTLPTLAAAKRFANQQFADHCR